LSTLQVGPEELDEFYKENEVLRRKVTDLRERAKDKYSGGDGVSDEEIDDLVKEYEALLDRHATQILPLPFSHYCISITSMLTSSKL
jgi:hypothetical protein